MTKLTDAQWREFQDIPEQGYSHRHWVDERLREAAVHALLDAADAPEFRSFGDEWARNALRERARAISKERDVTTSGEKDAR
jgi:hypothetical protein